MNYDRREVVSAIGKARTSLMERQPTVSKIFSTLQKTFAGCEIVTCRLTDVSSWLYAENPARDLIEEGVQSLMLPRGACLRERYNLD